MSEEKKQLTGADIRLDADAKAAIVNALAEKMRLRQWCVEQSVKCQEGLTLEGIQNATQFFFNFVTDMETSDE